MCKRIYPENRFRDIPSKYFEECENGGRIVRFTYMTRDHQTGDGAEFEKYALVYLPHGYDENDTETSYNVFYLMHGGSDSPEWFFGGEGMNDKLKNVLDHMIYNGESEPFIVCAVSYYTEYSGDATKNCIDFHYELMNDIIPIFERKYRTYAASVASGDLKNSRWHRAFGGFSMGACATWSVFEHCLDEMAYFMPISGDCWALGCKAGGTQAAETAQFLADKVRECGMNAADFIIYSGCGRNDIAEPNLTPQINAMKLLPDTFIYCDNFADGNLYQCIYENGGHDKNTVMRVLYNGMPKMFG